MLLRVLIAAFVTLAAFPAAATAHQVEEAEGRVHEVETELARLRAEYAVLAEQADAAGGRLDRAQVRIVNLQRAIDDADVVVATAQLGVKVRARRAYMGDPLGNVGAALRVREYAQIDAYLPYIARPLEQDRRTALVYKQRLRALRDLEHDLDTAKDQAARDASDLFKLEAKLTGNLDTQQDRLETARADLRAAEAERARRERLAASEPDPVDVPPAPRVLPNGVELGPAAGIPDGMKSSGTKLSGVASWYGPGFHGRTTSNGEVYDQYGFSAAHKTLPFETVLLVSFRDRSVLVRVNDRGPYIEGRFLDLSKGAADALGITGLAYVDAEILIPA